MPLVRITLPRPHPPEYLRDLSEAIHQALVTQANVPADDKFHVIEVAHMVAHPSYGGVQRSENVVFIQITLNAGRTVEIKKALYADIVRRLQAAVDIRPDDVLISLVEVTKENWSFGNGIATYAG